MTSMMIIRFILRAILLVVMSVAIAGWITAATLQSTLLNRVVVKDWFSQSKVYDNLLANLVRVDQNQETGQQILNVAVLQQAIGQTFPPAYLKMQSELVLDATYDWLDGTKNTIDFQINFSDKQTDFRTHLAAALEQQLITLPVCASSLTLDSKACLPPGTTPRAFAEQIARQTTDSGAFFDKPITPQTFAIPGAEQLGWLAGVSQKVAMAIWVLPIVTLFATVGYVFLASSWLKGLRAVGRRTFFNALISTALGFAAWQFAGSLQFASILNLPADGPNIGRIIDPMLQTVVPSIGQSLALWSGIVAALGLAVWICAIVLRRRKESSFKHAVIPPPAMQPKELPRPVVDAASGAVQPEAKIDKKL